MNDSPTDIVKAARRVTWIGFYVNALLMVVKIVVGWLGHSSVLVADGLHSLSDFATDIVALVFIGLAAKKADDDHPYGHGKYETMASLFIAVALLAVAGGIGYEAIESIISVVGGTPIPRPDMSTLYVALLSIAAKEWLFRYTLSEGKRLSSSLLITNAWHHRSDSLSSIATVVGILAILLLGGRWAIVEPAAAALIALFIAISAVKIALPSFNQLLERSLPDDTIRLIGQTISSTPGVKDYHRLRTRLNGSNPIIDVHLKVDPDISVNKAHAIATATENALRRQLGESAIINTHIEPYTQS